MDNVEISSQSDECSDRSDGNQKFKHSRHSSKRDCKAYIVASEIMQFPDYKVIFVCIGLEANQWAFVVC